MQKRFLGSWETFEPLSVARGSGFSFLLERGDSRSFKIGILADVPSQVVQQETSSDL